MNDKKEKNHVAHLSFKILFSIIAALGLIIFNNMSNSLERTEIIVTDLKVQFATVLTKNTNFESQISEIKIAQKDLEKRVRVIETN